MIGSHAAREHVEPCLFGAIRRNAVLAAHLFDNRFAVLPVTEAVELVGSYWDVIRCSEVYEPDFVSSCSCQPVKSIQVKIVDRPSQT